MKTAFGLIMTLTWCLLWGGVIFNSWCSVIEMPLNELGDFFAGIFAPLAFLWLVIGYFQQGQELTLNTKALEKQEEALRLQVNELQQSVEQQREMVEITQKELEMTKLSNERQYKKDKLFAQPLLRFEKGQPISAGRTILYDVLIKNIGHVVRSVNISIDSHPSFLSLDTIFIDNWDFDVTKAIRILYSSEQVFEGVEFFELNLTFIDGLAEDSKLTLYCKVNQRGSIVTSSEPLNV
ncbi:hypothetical protein V4V60_004009 [Vibrio mimicus]|nr:hypothetical protein [Vibrio cholerae]